jgi:hypothetical protein
MDDTKGKTTMYISRSARPKNGKKTSTSTIEKSRFELSFQRCIRGPQLVWDKVPGNRSMCALDRVN